MNESATFFRNRKEDQGETYQFCVKTGSEIYRFSVYSRRPLQSRRFVDQEIAQKDVSGFAKKVCEEVEKDGDGGLVVIVSGEERARSVEVRRLGPDLAEPARRFAVLIPGMPADFRQIQEKHRVPPGTHAIVPVDAAAEERLAAFVEQLPWFSPDFGSLVLNALRRPSLDARLSDVETRLFGKTAEEARDEAVARGWRRLRLRARRALSRPAVYAFASFVLVAIVLAGNAVLLYGLNSRMDAKSGVPASGLPARDSNKAAVKPADPVMQDALAVNMRILLQELRSKSSNATIQILYNEHFKPFDQPSASDAQIAAWFKNQDGNGGSRPLLWGIIKLQALKLQIAQPNLAFLQKWDSIAATKKVFENLGNLDKDATDQRLRAALSCRMRYRTPPFTYDHESCDDLTDDDINDGLVPLIDFLKTIQ
jgi:hypothetical protein